MSLRTPEKIRTLQRKLYLKAKAEPEYRFYLLYDKIYREDILEHAYRLAKTKGGAPGVDGVSFEGIESEGREKWLAGIREELHEKRYKAQPVRRVMIPKPGGGQRPLGIPTIRDRVVQTAAKLVVEPIFEADLDVGQNPFRPAFFAANPGEALMEIPASQVPDHDVLQVRTPEAVTLLEPLRPEHLQALVVILHALVEGRQVGLSGPVDRAGVGHGSEKKKPERERSGSTFWGETPGQAACQG
jgi:hypothetical protein